MFLVGAKIQLFCISMQIKSLIYKAKPENSVIISAFTHLFLFHYRCPSINEFIIIVKSSLSVTNIIFPANYLISVKSSIFYPEFRE